MDPIIIIGSGLAGYTLAKEYRKLSSGDMVLITQDDGSFYSKPMLSNALDKGKTPQQLINATAEKMMEQNNFKLLVNTLVAEINLKEKKLVTDKGDTIFYSKLVLALGATPINTAPSHLQKKTVFSVNNLGDYASFRDALENKRKVAIIGPGLIGCEFANDLIQVGYQVDVIGPGTHPVNGIVPEPVGFYLKQALEDKGVTWHLGALVESIEDQEEGVQLNLDNGEKLNADLVLSAIGLRANIGLAEQAGLTVNRGIVVDAYLQTSETDVYALGDCAEVEGKLLPYIMPLMACARALAKTLAGDATPVSYPIMPVVIKTPACPVVTCPPDKGLAGEWQYEQDAEGITATFYDSNNKLKGFCLAGSGISKKQSLVKQMQE